MTRHLPGQLPPLERVLARLEIGDCWEWTLYLNRGGYGVAGVEGKRVLVHRYVWEKLVGPIPDGMQVDHLCCNRKCANPDHLEPVTAQVNTDRVRTPNRWIEWHRAQTHCQKGHSLDDAYRPPGTNTRQCRTCKRIRGRGYKAARRCRRQATVKGWA